MLSKLKHWVTLCTNCKLQSQQFPPDVWDTKNHLDNKKSCSAQWWMKDKHLLLNNLTFLFGILQIMANLYIQKGKLKYGHFVQWFHFPIRNIPVYFSTLQMPHKASWAPDQHHTQPQSHIPVFTNISQTERSARPRAANPPAEPKLLSNKHSLLSTPTIDCWDCPKKPHKAPNSSVPLQQAVDDRESSAKQPQTSQSSAKAASGIWSEIIWVFCQNQKLPACWEWDSWS